MRSLLFALAVCLTVIVSTGCAQAPTKGRDLNAETIEQMGFWGGSPGL